METIQQKQNEKENEMKASKRKSRIGSVLANLAGVTLLAAMVFALSVAPANAAAIYYESFSGTSGTALNGTAPDIRPGTETWVSRVQDGYVAWYADGSTADTVYDDNAYLPFTPDSGKLYTLSVEMDPTSGTDGLFAFGFTEDDGVGNSFYWNLEDGTADNSKPWLNFSLDHETVTTYLGPGNDGDATHTISDTGLVLFSIELDTRPTKWQAKWYHDGNLLRTADYETNPEINYVGFGTKQTEGTVDNFQLEVIPEPASLGLFGIVCGALWFVRRKFRNIQS